MIRSIAIALSLLAAAGCSDRNNLLLNKGEGGEISKLPLSAVEISLNSGYVRKTLQLDVTTSLQGTDLDLNGVRDDVDAFIDEAYETRLQSQAAKYFARVMQLGINLDNPDPVMANKLAAISSRAVTCIFAAFDGADGSKQAKQVVKELREITTNTKERLHAYLAYTRSVDASAGDLAKAEKCGFPGGNRSSEAAAALINPKGA